MYESKQWVNRQSEHPARRRLTPTGNDNEYDVSRAEGVIMEDGDAFDADTMNDLERRISDGFLEYDPQSKGVDVTVQPYTCTKSGSVYALTGSGAIGRCKIPAAWSSGDTWTVNGAAVPAYCGADAVDGDCIVAGRWVLFTFDGARLDFNGGGGLSGSKLAQATAAEKYTLRNRTFYAGGKALRTGTMPNLSLAQSSGGDAVTGLNSEYPQVGVDVTTTYWYTTNMDGVKRLCLRPHFGAFGGDDIVLDADGYVGIDAATLGTAPPAHVLEGDTFTSGASGSVGAGGTMPNRGAWSAEITPGGLASIPDGYHNGGGNVRAKSIQYGSCTIDANNGSLRHTITEGTLVGVTGVSLPNAGYQTINPGVSVWLEGNKICVDVGRVDGYVTITVNYAYY